MREAICTGKKTSNDASAEDEEKEKPSARLGEFIFIEVKEETTASSKAASRKVCEAL